MTVQPLITKPGRLIQTIHDTANSFGAQGIWGEEPNQTGVCRLALSDLDKQVRDWFIQEVKKLGCKVKIDQMGSIFATYPGKDNSKLPTAIGLHLDTQPTGGRYDGIYGVLSGLEVLRTFKENNFIPNYPVTVINWTNEEGARFPQLIMASAVWSGQLAKETAYNLKSVTDDKPVSVEHELKRIGYLGDVEASYQANPIAAHFEIHIEQGPILENENKEIGVVMGVQAYSWIEVIVSGKASHTGTTPLYARSDALLASSEMIVKGREIATNHNGLFSVGILHLSPAVVNVIPGDVKFTIDVRHIEDNQLAQIIDEVHDSFNKIAKLSGKSVSVEFNHLHTSNAVKFNQDCISCVEELATELFGSSKIRQITSGAGHDLCSTSSRVPTSMIFIPSRDGVSHNPEEYSTPQQVENGFQVLLSTVLKYDALRKARS